MAMAFTTICRNSLILVLTFLSLKFPNVCHGEHHRPTYSRGLMEQRYRNWIETHGKQYKDQNEWELRFGIYQSNVEFVEYINSQNLSFKLTDNCFADMTNEEFNSKYMGRLKNIIPTSNPTPINKSHHYYLPTEIDWREKGAVTDIQDQGVCGSCWAFSAIAAVEGLHMIKTGELVKLSEQELVDCDRSENLGCQGGFMESAFMYIILNGGVASEEDYPYTGKDGKCNKAKLHRPINIKGYKMLPPGDEDSLEVAVAAQPVSVAIDASGYEFQLYDKGVFDGYCGTSLNHGATAVGYGEEDGVKHWIVKNSWGPNWGEGGYIRLRRKISQKSGKCGIAKQSSYPV